MTEDYEQNVRSIQRLVKLFEERGWEIHVIASGHSVPRYTQDGLADIKRLLASNGNI